MSGEHGGLLREHRCHLKEHRGALRENYCDQNQHRGDHLSNPDLARAASPAFQVGPNTPPLLIFHGTKDTVVLPAQSERMAAAYRGAGCPVELRLKPGARHKTNDFSAPEDRIALRTFLTKHLAP